MDSDGTGPCTQVYAVWARVGFYGHALSSPGDECSRPRGRGVDHAYWRVKAPEWDGRMRRSLLGRGKRGTSGLVLGLVF
jgi:hypothetical protein